MFLWLPACHEGGSSVQQGGVVLKRACCHSHVPTSDVHRPTVLVSLRSPALGPHERYVNEALRLSQNSQVYTQLFSNGTRQFAPGHIHRQRYRYRTPRLFRLQSDIDLCRRELTWDGGTQTCSRACKAQFLANQLSICPPTR